MPDVPMRWPAAWQDASLVAGTPIDCALGNPAVQGIPALESPPPEVAAVTGVWARIRQGRGGGAGPTGRPWIETNGWRIQLERTRNPGRAVWVDTQPPAGQVLTANEYGLMIADAEAYGARWILTLDERFAEGVAAAEQAAVGAWKSVGAWLNFFASHRDWSAFATVASIGVICDFEGSNRFLGHELLNLAARRPMPLTIVRNGELERLRAAVLLQSAAGLEEKLSRFVAGGGMLLARENVIPQAAPAAPRHGYRAWDYGKGVIVAPPAPWTDPYGFTADVHLLTGREMDVIRTYNATSVNLTYTQSGDGSRGVVQLLNYAARTPAAGVTVALAKRWKGARLLTAAQPGGEKLPVESSRYGVEVPLPAFPVYAAIELEA